MGAERGSRGMSVSRSAVVRLAVVCVFTFVAALSLRANAGGAVETFETGMTHDSSTFTSSAIGFELTGVFRVRDSRTDYPFGPPDIGAGGSRWYVAQPFNNRS